MVSRHSLQRRVDVLLNSLYRLRGEPKPPISPDVNAIQVPFRDAVIAGGKRVAVIAHLFYPDLAVELREHAGHIPGEVDLLVTTDSPSKAGEIASTLSGWPGGEVRIEVVPNRGRDMFGKYVTYGPNHADYDLLLFVHGKRSKHLEDGDQWRGYLYRSLFGSPEVVRSILAIFEQDPRVGIVYPEAIDRRYHHWGENRRMAGRLARRMGVDLRRASYLDFPAGSMFWARPAALRGMLRLGIRDFPPDLGLVDGTLAHALERLVLYSSEIEGCTAVKIATSESVEAELTKVESPEELRGAIRRCRAGPLLTPS